MVNVINKNKNKLFEKEISHCEKNPFQKSENFTHPVNRKEISKIKKIFTNQPDHDIEQQKNTNKSKIKIKLTCTYSRFFYCSWIYRSYGFHSSLLVMTIHGN
jgi:hypothetical protein